MSNESDGDSDHQILGEDIVYQGEDPQEIATIPEEDIVANVNSGDKTPEALSGIKHTLRKQNQNTDSTPDLAGDDIDADWSGSGNTGEEDSFASVETPDKDIIDELSEPWGTDYQDNEELDVNKKNKELQNKRDADEFNKEE